MPRLYNLYVEEEVLGVAIHISRIGMAYFRHVYLTSLAV